MSCDAWIHTKFHKVWCLQIWVGNWQLYLISEKMLLLSGKLPAHVISKSMWFQPILWAVTQKQVLWVGGPPKSQWPENHQKPQTWWTHTFQIECVNNTFIYIYIYACEICINIHTFTYVIFINTHGDIYIYMYICIYIYSINMYLCVKFNMHLHNGICIFICMNVCKET